MTLPDWPVIIAAAGRSTRMGRAKTLLPLGSGTWLEWQLDQLAAAGLKRALLMQPPGGYAGSAEPDWLLRSLDEPVRHRGLTLHSRRGERADAPQMASLQLAVRHLLDGEEPVAAWLLPVDVPAAGPAVWQEMAQAYLAAARGRCRAVLPADGGHPVLLDRDLLGDLTALDPAHPAARLDHVLDHENASGRLLRGRHLDGRCRMNLNTPDDWKAWLVQAHLAQSGDPERAPEREGERA